jgi:endonuclease YncB( thermonuclease family)
MGYPTSGRRMTNRNQRRSHAWRAALLILLCVAAAHVRADFCGRVVKVHDGDTVTVLAGGGELRVRLVGIDAPERGQPYGSASRRGLAGRVGGRAVKVIEAGIDSYGRTLGRVLVAGTDANAAQVRDGYAWVYRRFENDVALIAQEAEAKAARRGLWRDPEPVPPWVWRERHPRTPATPGALAPGAAITRQEE